MFPSFSRDLIKRCLIYQIRAKFGIEGETHNQPFANSRQRGNPKIGLHLSFEPGSARCMTSNYKVRWQNPWNVTETTSPPRRHATPFLSATCHSINKSLCLSKGGNECPRKSPRSTIYIVKSKLRHNMHQHIMGAATATRNTITVTHINKCVC